MQLQRQHEHSVQTNQSSMEINSSCVTTHVQEMSKMGQTKDRREGKATEPYTTDLTSNNSEQLGARKKLSPLFIYIYIQKQRPHKMIATLSPSNVSITGMVKILAYMPQSAKHEDRGHIGHRDKRQKNEIDQ